MKTCHDIEGNQYILKKDGSLILRLKNKKCTIGHITGRILYITRKRLIHLHRASNSYGINRFVVDNAKTFDYIVLEDEFGRYKIPLADLRKRNNPHLHFKKVGFELQVMIPVDELENYRI